MEEKFNKIISDYNNGWISWNEAKNKAIDAIADFYKDTFWTPSLPTDVLYDGLILFGMMIKDKEDDTVQ